MIKKKDKRNGKIEHKKVSYKFLSPAIASKTKKHANLLLPSLFYDQ